MGSITSRQNPVVRALRDLARTPDPVGRRLLLDGVHLVREAAAAGVEFEVVALRAASSARSDEAAVAQALEERGVPVHVVAAQAFAALSPVRAPSGIVAIARRAPVAAHHICGADDAFILSMVDVQDPGNVGSMIRAAEAGGITGVLVCGASANPFSWKALRGSMGSTLRLPVAAGLTVDDAIRCIKGNGGRIIAAVPRQGRAPDAIEWRGRLALMLGGEGPGLGEKAVAAADALVTIPMVPPVESLNVAVAAGILVYAARRQRIPVDYARDGLGTRRKP